MPAVSVIVPVYNTEKYLSKCLDSLTGQTLSDIEIICVNDCSSDGSPSILKEYAARDSRIRIIDFKENKGVSVARNTGIDAATGEYIGFVDSDDFVDADFYEKLYTKAKEANADAVKGSIKIISAEKYSSKSVYYDINDDIKNNIGYFYNSFTSAIYSRKFIKDNRIRFPENAPYFEDPYFSILAAIHYKTIAIVDNASYFYVDRQDSVTKSDASPNAIKCIICVISDLIDIINNSNVEQKIYVVLWAFLIRTLKNYMWNKDIPVDVNCMALKTFSKAFCSCLYPEESLSEFFSYEEKMAKRLFIQNLRQNLNKGN